MVNPLDLFSEDTPQRDTSQLIRPSSPIQETDTLKELRLVELQKELLDKRNALKEDVTKLEAQWNEMRTNAEVEENNEEDDMIFELLIQRANNDKSKPSDSVHEVVEPNDQAETNAEIDLDRFSAKPSKDWDLRIEYLQKFYPDISITDHSSKVTLEYNDPNRPRQSQQVKTIAFTLKYRKNLIRFDVQVKLIKLEKSYTLQDLIVNKTSNNKLNTLLTNISQFYSQTKNITEFLYTINTLYTNLQSRQRTFNELFQQYEQPQSNIFQNQFTYKEIILLWDFVLQDGDIISLINVNESYNDVFEDLVGQYGVLKALNMLITNVYPEKDNNE